MDICVSKNEIFISPEFYRLVWEGDVKGLEEALDAGKVDVNSFIQTSKRTFLHIAVQRGNLSLVKMLVGKGADRSAADVDGISPLGYAQRMSQLLQWTPASALSTSISAIISVLDEITPNPPLETAGKLPPDIPSFTPAFERTSTDPVSSGSTAVDGLPSLMIELELRRANTDVQSVEYMSKAKEKLNDRLMSGCQVFSDLTLERISSEHHEFPFKLPSLVEKLPKIFGDSEDLIFDGFQEEKETQQTEPPDSCDQSTEKTIHTAENVLSSVVDNSPLESSIVRESKQSYIVPRYRSLSFSGPTCQICLLSHPKELLFNPCRSENCYGLFCKPCVEQYFTLVVENSRYCCPAMRCPSCRQRLPTKNWSVLVPTEIFEGYKSNARSLTLMKCVGCDTLHPVIPFDDWDNQLTHEWRVKAQSEAFKGLARESVNRLLGSWAQFNNASITPESMVEVLRHEFCTHGEEEQRQHWMLRCTEHVFMMDEWSVDEYGEVIIPRVQYLFGLITDVERRTALQLAWLRRFPKIQTRCCGELMCFKCKVQGWHDGVTCEERQASEAEIETQFCPGCNVPTIRSEGCSSMTCICGAVWEWEGDADNY